MPEHEHPIDQLTRNDMEQLLGDFLERSVAATERSEARVMERIGGLEDEVREGFARTDQRFEAVHEDIDTLYGEVRGLRTDVDTLTSDVKELRTDVDGLTADVKVLRTDVGGLKTDVAGLRTDVTSLQTDVATVQNDIGDIREDTRAIRRHVGMPARARRAPKVAA